MANDLLGVSVTGLRLSQAALSTVGHNIANANTEGYSRQRVQPVTNPATLYSGSYIGNGVNVDSVQRIVNNFVTDQLRTDNTLLSDLDVYFEHVEQLDNLLSDQSTGLSGSLNTFFAAMQNGADDPTSIPARQLIISEADNLADRFNSIYGRLTTIEKSVRDGMSVAVSHINALATNIAQLNVKISDAYGVGNSASPNDLLDQREQALKELASLVPVQVFDQGRGQLNVVIGTGQSLIIGPDARQLSLIPSPGDPSQLDVQYNSGGQVQSITDSITGGELGGLIRFRSSILDEVYNSLGRVGVVMADTFNNFHSQGVNLENEFGGNFFYDINDEGVAQNRVIANANNESSENQVLALYIRDSVQLSNSDYSVKIEGGGSYRITREEDGVDVAKGLMPGQYPYSVTFDGMELVFEQGSFQPGDSFKLQPVKFGAQEFATAVTNAEDIAFASPLLTDASLGNLGTGVISDGEVLSLNDNNGNPLPLFANTGEMNPPLIVVFNSPTSYDILDNSDPGNPAQLNPPIRDQRFVPGVSNLLFNSEVGATMVSTSGDMIGLPDGRRQVTQAALFPANADTNFAVTDFSGANQFSFDVTVNNTINGVSDGTFNVVINGAAITDNDALITAINAQLGGTDVEAYITGEGGGAQLAFRLTTAGYGNIDLAYSAPAANQALASNLTGIDFNFSYSTDGNADGVEGSGLLTNGYPAEAVMITRAPASPGLQPTQTRLFTTMNASAKETASMLGNLPGVDANAFNYVELSDLQVSHAEPLQIVLNGENLISYSVGSTGAYNALGPDVPDPASQPDAFYQYLATQINDNSTLSRAGIYAVAGFDELTGSQELRIFSSEGDDLTVGLTAQGGESIAVSDGEHGSVQLDGAGNQVASQIVVGGRMDITLAEGVSLSTLPPDSMLFGDTRVADFAQNTYLGIQAAISGAPDTGDTFTLDFNRDAASDNRNALLLAGLQSAKTMGGGSASFSQSYGTLVETAGIETNSVKINRDAAEEVLRQTEALRNSISGVNLDEEAADLIRFEHLFSANAQVISVARDIFDRLISSF